MWKEKIIEAKKAHNITTKMMSEKVRLPEQTITRILTGKTATPRIDTVLDLGASVGLSALELFAETTSFLGDKKLAELQTEVERLTVEKEALGSVNEELSDKVKELIMENTTLKMKLELQEETISLYRIILNLTNLGEGKDNNK